MRRFLLDAFFALAGCQSKADALQIVCNVPLDPDVQATEPSRRMSIAAKKIDAEVSNSEVKVMMKRFATMSPTERIGAMRKEIDAVGIKQCPIIDIFAQ